MRKIGYVLLIIIILFIGYGIINEITFSPLGRGEFKQIFPNYNGKIEVAYHKDFIGWSRGDLFELYIYSLDNVYIDSDYPRIEKDWEYVTLPDPLAPDDLIITKWHKCPIDTLMLSKYDFILEQVISKETNGEMLKQDINDATNYYCCIYVSGLEKYFLLYCPSKNRLYYIRQRGF